MPPAPTFSRNGNGNPKLFLVQTPESTTLPEQGKSDFTLPRLNRRNALLAAIALSLFVALHLILEHVFHL